jgi:hypothetical protein
VHFVLICNVVVLYCFVMYVCVCVCGGGGGCNVCVCEGSVICGCLVICILYFDFFSYPD